MLNGCCWPSFYESSEMLCFDLNSVGGIRDTALALLFDGCPNIGVAARTASRRWVGSDEIMSRKNGLAGGLGIRSRQYCLNSWCDRQGRR